MVSPSFAASPRLTRISPPGGQRGTIVETYFHGRFLDQPREVLFYEPGITVVSLEPLQGEVEINGRKEKVEAGTRVRVRLKLAADCPLGPHGIRMCTTRGVTDYRRFFVGPFPTVEEDEQPQKRNDTRATAQAVPLNCTVLGRLSEPTDVDAYRIEVRQGQRISAEVEAARLGVDRGLPEVHLAIYDADGKTLAAADDSSLFVQDPVLSIVAPRDGAYFVEVRHSTYNAANDTYRLHVGTFARPTGVYPAGGQAGTELTLQVLGDPRGIWKQTIRLPREPGNFPFIASAGNSDVPAPSPNMLRVSPFPNILEMEPNNSPDAVPESRTVGLPAAFNGIIDKPGDVDCFRFRAKKGEQLRCHALANALGSPLDPTIWIKPVGDKPGGVKFRATDSQSNQLGVPPMGSLSRDNLDPVLEFTVPADGDYILGVEDDRGRGGNDYVYRVEVQSQASVVYTYIPPEPENQFMPQWRQAVSVAAGNRYNTQVAIFSTDRPFNGELELVAVGLPRGVTLHAPRLRPDMTRVPVVFAAAADARPQAALIDLVVRPVGDKMPALTSGYRQIIPMNQYGNDPYLPVLVDKLAVVVTEPAPFRIEVEEPRSALVQNGEMALKFSIRRKEGFTEPVTVRMEWRPNGINSTTPVTLAADQTEGQYLLGAARNASAGSYQVALTATSGSARQGYTETSNPIYVASQPVRLTVAEPHLEARFVRTSIERGKTAQLVCKLNHLQPFVGKARATLARLPRGVELVEPTQEITSEDKEITFTLRATPDCLVGNYQGIVLDLTVIEDGQAIRQLSGYGLLRIDAERGVQPGAK